MAPVSATDGQAWVVALSRREAGRAACDGSLFALSNGTIGVRGGIDELCSDNACFLADGHVRQPLSYHERFTGFADATDTRVAVGSATDLRVLIDGELVDFSSAEIADFEQALDLRSGVLRRRTRWRLANGNHLEISAKRVVPFGYGAVVVSRIEVAPLDFNAAITLTFPITSAGRASEFAADDPRIAANGPPAVERGSFSEGATAFALRSIGELTVTSAQQIVSSHHIGIDDDGIQQVTGKCAEGEAIAIERFVAFAHCRGDTDDALLKSARNRLSALAGTTFDAFAASQQRTLDTFWAGADIAINGDAELERTIRFNLFHVFQSASRDDTHSVAAKGLTGEGYEGHYFWDTEAFILPVLALTDAALARHILRYRIAKLDRARAHARALGHARGALFPWRTIAGNECSAHYPTGSAQYHINAAIAFALETYLAATDDDALLYDGGAELLFETARIWLEIGHFSERRGGAFVIHGVTGPDEYTALVDNDYYTNAMARRHLRFACEVAARLSAQNPHGFNTIAKQIGLGADESSAWRRAADRMWLPVDPALGISPQDDSFLDKPPFDFGSLPRDQFPLLLHYHPMTLFRHQVCKQGDVVQAMVMADADATATLKSRNLAYYERLTTHDSTLSSTAFAILSAEVGEDEKALHYFRETAFVDLENRHGNTGHGAHMAALAGSWLILAQGWGGLRIYEGELHFRPRCPRQWRGYSFRLGWRASRIEVRVDGHGATYRLLDGAPVTVIDQGRRIEIGAEPQFVLPPAIKAVIFDLDGVLTDTAAAHYRAWKRLCDEEGIPFDERVNERLKGVDRAGSLRIILENAGQEVDEATFVAMMARKNGYYRDSIAAYSAADLFPGAARLLKDCQRAGLKLALASASRNAAELVARLGIEAAFDFIANAGTIERPKPDPEVFLACAAALGVEPSACVGVEDAAAGISAIIAAGMRPVGIGESASLAAADIVLPVIASLSVEQVVVSADVTTARRLSSL